MTVQAPREARQRKQDTLARFRADDDAWVATAGKPGSAYMVPLSFLWDGEAFILATPESSLTAKNLQAWGKARLAFGPTRDVVIVDGNVESFTLETVPANLAAAFAARQWDPRELDERYAYFRVTPHRIQAWREENELAGRLLMKDGRWLA
ncbi:MAG TPA: pyridoxamine 5'-phosphate oxidase family protein [Streptosporangiaceae bacterium]